MIEIIIIDDHYLIREGLKLSINNETDMKVIKEVESAHSLINLLMNDPRTYDVMILDINLPDSYGLETLKNVLNLRPDQNILILTIHPETRFAERAIKSGAKGYLNKNCTSTQLHKAIRKIAQGRNYVSESMAEILASKLDEESADKPHENLSDREFEVLRLIGKGMNTVDIADYLALSPSTIHTYKTRILNKMNMKSRSELMFYVINNDLIY